MRALGILVVLALISLTIGYFSGWVSFASESSGDSSALRIRIDRTEFKEDMKSIGSATRGAAETLDNAADTAADKLTGDDGERTMFANVVSVSIPMGTITLAYEDGAQRTLPITADDRSLASSLSVGDRVVVRSEDGQIVDVRRR